MMISNIRKRRGWSRAELARRAGMNGGTVGLIESGRFKPYPGQLRKLASALGLPEEESERLLEEGCTATGEPDLKSGLRT